MIGTPGNKITREAQFPEYVKYIDNLDQSGFEPYKDSKKDRNEVLSKKGMDRVTTWVKYHILEPKFDNPGSQMPNMGLTVDEADFLADFLVNQKNEPEPGMKEVLLGLENGHFPVPRYRYVVYSFFIGVFITLFFVAGYKHFGTKRRPG